MPAEKGRWMFVVLGFIINICLGSVYAYSVFRGPVAKLLNMSATEAGLPFMVFLALFATMVFFGGLLLAKLGPKMLGWLGGIVVGVGNIYANEALFQAGIHPLRPGRSLSPAEGKSLQEAIVSVLGKAVERGGTTLNDYRDADGEPGFFQLDLAVYGREEEPCPRCGGKIVRLRHEGRSSFLCEACQK